jgi:tryptophan synthase alpha chain
MDTLEKNMLSGKKALIAYFTIGYPSVMESVATCKALADAGADCIELGIPFSDPLADGPTIQAASYKAIAAGGGLKAGIRAAGELRKSCVDVPLVIFSYYNPIFRMGLADFAKRAADADADAALVPDLPVEEAGPLIEALVAQKLGMIFLAAPTSTANRLKLIQEHSSGFVYAVSVTGVTGERKGLPDYLPGFVKRIKEAGKLPVAVGFGVSGPEQAEEVAKLADGAVVGSAFLHAYDSGGVKAAGRLAGDIKKALGGGH